MERRTVKCCLLDMMRSLHSEVHSSHGYLYKTKSGTSQHGQGGSPKPSLLAEELLAGDGYLGRESPFSSGGVAFARLLMPSG